MLKKKKRSKKEAFRDEVRREFKAEHKELAAIRKEETKIEQELEALKMELRPEVVEKFTIKDIARGVVGSIFGMSIMAWHEGVQHAALEMAPWRLVLVVLLTVIGGTSVLYFSQYKKIKETWIIHHLLPKRFLIFYALSIGMVAFLYFVFGIITLATPHEEVIRLLIVMGLPAMIGASAAEIVK